MKTFRITPEENPHYYTYGLTKNIGEREFKNHSKEIWETNIFQMNFSHHFKANVKMRKFNGKQ